MKVDQNAIKFNQASLIGSIVVAFLLDQPAIVGLVALVLAVGTIDPRLALFKQIYRRVFVRLGVIQPNVIPDDPTPHRFAQGVGALFLTLSTLLLVAGLALPGWLLAGIVVLLAGINLVFGVCAGCFMYYQLVRFGLLQSRAQQS